MKPFLEKILIGSRFAGLEIQLGEEGKLMHLVILKRKGKEVIVEKHITGIGSIEKLAVHLPAGVPVVMQITGKGVLYRKVQADPGAEKIKLLAKIFPNASLKDFLLETVPAAGDEIYVSVLRKTIADDLAAELTERKFSVVDTGIGVTSVAAVLSLLSEPGNKISFGKHMLLFNEGELSEVFFEENGDGEGEMNAGGQKIAKQALPAFAAAFRQLLPVRDKTGNDLRTEFLQKRLFRKAITTFVAATFLILLLNFFFFCFYRDQCNSLREKLETNGDASGELHQLETRIAEKKKFLSGSGLSGFSHHAYYADRIAAGIPEEITLTEMNLSPGIKQADNDSIGFTPGEILLTGTCSESIYLNSWLQELKSENWIRSAALEKYFRDKTMARGEFHIVLNLK